MHSSLAVLPVKICVGVRGKAWLQGSGSPVSGSQASPLSLTVLVKCLAQNQTRWAIEVDQKVAVWIEGNKTVGILIVQGAESGFKGFSRWDLRRHKLRRYLLRRCQWIHKRQFKPSGGH